jgi:hypothetical protein
MYRVYIEDSIFTEFNAIILKWYYHPRCHGSWNLLLVVLPPVVEGKLREACGGLSTLTLV